MLPTTPSQPREGGQGRPLAAAVLVLSGDLAQTAAWATASATADHVVVTPGDAAPPWPTGPRSTRSDRRTPRPGHPLPAGRASRRHRGRWTGRFAGRERLRCRAPPPGWAGASCLAVVGVPPAAAVVGRACRAPRGAGRWAAARERELGTPRPAARRTPGRLSWARVVLGEPRRHDVGEILERLVCSGPTTASGAPCWSWTSLEETWTACSDGRRSHRLSRGALPRTGRTAVRPWCSSSSSAPTTSTGSPTSRGCSESRKQNTAGGPGTPTPGRRRRAITTPGNASRAPRSTTASSTPSYRRRR